MPSLTIIRGLPGSGKSTLARQFAEQGHLWTETDFHMMDEHGLYSYSKERLAKAIALVEQEVAEWLDEGRDVVIAGTFTRLISMQSHIESARNAGLSKACILEPQTSWAWNPYELERRCIHQVPLDVIKRMMNAWESLEPGEYLIEDFWQQQIEKARSVQKKTRI